jgi:hypothetical protein
VEIVKNQKDPKVDPGREKCGVKQWLLGGV